MATISSINGLKNSETVSISGIFESSNAGNNIPITCSISGTASSNYSLTQTELSANITPRPITVSGLTVNNKLYNLGDTAATVKGIATYSNVVSGESNPTISWSFVDDSIADGKIVNGSTSTNYSVTSLLGNIIQTRGVSVLKALEYTNRLKYNGLPILKNNENQHWMHIRTNP